ncbi:MAG: hypothetical protein HN348_31600, partial [Proteobacteria bacterium]|nr:hypothetical protein [Pseudomonadota bacterium]
RRHSTRDVQGWVDQLSAKQQVLQEGRIQMPYPANEQRTRTLLAHGRYESMVELVADVEPLLPIGAWGYEQSREGTINRELRRALLSGDDAGAEDLWVRANGNMPLWEWFADPLAPELFELLTSKMVGVVANGLSRISLQNALPLKGFSKLLQSLLRRHKTAALAAISAREAVFGGDHQQAQSLVAILSKDDWVYTQALVAFVGHDIAKAVALYARALATERKGRGTNKLVPLAPEAFFLPLAFLLSSQKSRPPQALRLIKLAADQGYFRSDLPWSGWPHLSRLVDAKAELALPGAHPVAVLIEALSCWWRGLDLDGTERLKAISKARECGWNWIADELANGPKGRGLASLRTVRPEWERRLEALVETFAPAKTPLPRTDKRLAWTLTTYGRQVHLEAREQVRRKTGWSVGKPIACKRLPISPDLPTTPADQALIKALRSRTYRSYRGYPETEYTWDAKVAWPALAGHPAIFDVDGQALTIVENKPRLLCRSVEGGTALSIDPPFDREGPQAHAVGNGYEVTIFSKQHARVAEIV